MPPILPFSIEIAGCPYNSVSTTVLHCDSNTKLRTVNRLSQFNYFVPVRGARYCEYCVCVVCSLRLFT